METLRAVISADLHMTSDPRASDAIVPLMRMQREFYDVFFQNVCDLNPDVFILTGDNTCSGREEDCAMLYGYLSHLCSRGIIPVVIPGNHDFDRCTKQQYAERYYPLLKKDARDPASLSYALSVKGVTFLAMDDTVPGSRSGFSQQTVFWLKQQLTQAYLKGNRAVFLAHHNLHSDAWQPDPRRYRRYPDELLPLLKRMNVQIACSGHLHDACIYRDESLTEIIPPMPLAGAHQYGLLRISGERADYILKRLSFEEPLKSRIAEKDRKAAENRKAAFAHMLGGVSEDEADFISRFLEAQSSGTVSEKRAILLNHPGCESVLRKLSGTNTGLWMRCLLPEGRPACDYAEIRFSRRKDG